MSEGGVLQGMLEIRTSKPSFHCFEGFGRKASLGQKWSGDTLDGAEVGWCTLDGAEVGW
jgi:hypothetical protein